MFTPRSGWLANRCFTLIGLLVVIAIMAGILLPASAASAAVPQPPKGAADIAPLAEVRTHPKMTGEYLPLLVDGDVNQRKSVAFVVGSKGPGRLTFAFVKPRMTTGLYFHQMQESYRAESFRVDADADGDGRYELNLGQGVCALPPSWAGLTWKPCMIRGLKLQFVKGLSTGRRAYPCLSKVMIFGTPLPGDVQQRRTMGRSVYTIEKVRAVRRTVDLSGKTRPVVILTPDLPAWRAVGDALAEALRTRLNARVVVTADPAAGLPTERNTVAIGNVNNNELTARLYFNHYVYADSLFPGDGEFTLRTVFEPYPWYGKGDVIVIGCSDPAGARRGVQALLDAVDARTGGLGYVQRISKPAPPKAIGDEKPTLMNFRLAVDAYFRTGNEKYARRAIAVLEALHTMYAAKYADTNDVPISWPEEMQSNFIFAGWDAFEKHPDLTDAQRLRFTGVFMKAMRGLVGHVGDWDMLGKRRLVAWNHTTYPLRGLYFAARYFHDFYGLTDTNEFLAKAESCFMSQARSWKPKEDSISYLSATMEPCCGYWLAEWRREFFENGNMRRFAEYILGICDNNGLPSGFGDTRMSLVPDIPLRNLPLAFWYTRDGRYLWALQKFSNGKWENPFHRDVAPQPDAEQLGVRVFALDRQLYQYTKLYPYYNERRSPPGVSPEAAFDKIAFRHTWQPDGQYLLLDGFGRGKHLHYDTQAINTFVSGGRKWLLDHDYLIRNTTEHNMASVLRDGRANRLVPSCAGVVATADGPTMGMTTTEAPNYLGLDWRRSIFWKKGAWFAVMDGFTARDADTYDVDLTWKVEDCGTETLPQPGAFRVERKDVNAITRDVYVINDPEASGGKTLLFTRPTSRFAFCVDLPGGTYRVALRAQGADTSADSIYVGTTGTPRAEVHLAKLEYQRTWIRTGFGGEYAVLRLPEGRRHVVNIWMRENPPVRLDRIIFCDTNEREVLAIEAESATRATDEDIAALPGDRFWIHCADDAQAHIERHTTRGITVPICLLWQRLGGRLDANARIEIANLLYTDQSAEPRNLEITRLAPNAVLIGGDDRALLTVGGIETTDLRSDAAMLCVAPDRVAWAKARTVSVCGHVIENETPSDGEFEPAPVLREKIIALLGTLDKSVRRSRTAAQAATDAPPRPPTPAWTVDLPGMSSAVRLRAADLDGDGREEILVAAADRVLALEESGRVRWSYELNSMCNDVNAGDADPAPGLEVVLAAGNHRLHLLDANGQLLRTAQVLAVPRYQHFGKTPQTPTCAAIFNTDGTPRIFVGTTNYDIITYDAAFRELHTVRKIVNHGGIEFHARDVNGDGKQEVFCTNRYGSLCGVDHTGRRIQSYYTSIGDMEAALDDIDGDGTVEAVFGSSTGDLRCRTLDTATPWRGGSKMRWRFDNFGYAVRRIRIGDADGDGKKEVLLASGTGYLYVLDAAGQTKWRYRVGQNVLDVVLGGTARTPRIACADSAGAVVWLDGQGREFTRLRLGVTPQRLLWCNGRLIVALPGRIAAYPMP